MVNIANAAEIQKEEQNMKQTITQMQAQTAKNTQAIAELYANAIFSERINDVDNESQKKVLKILGELIRFQPPDPKTLTKKSVEPPAKRSLPNKLENL